MRNTITKSKAYDTMYQSSGKVKLRFIETINSGYLQDWYKSGDLNAILLSGLFGILTLLLFRAGMSSSKTSFIWVRGSQIFRYLRENHKKGKSIYLMHVLSFIGRNINIILRLTGSTIMKVVKILPFISTVIVDSANSSALYERRRGIFLSRTSFESDAMLGLLFVARGLIILLGLIANIAQLRSFSRMLTRNPSSSAMVLNFSSQFILAAFIEACFNKTRPTPWLLLGTTMITLGMVFVSKYSKPSSRSLWAVRNS